MQASDFVSGGGVVSVDSMVLSTHKTPGMFTSRTLDAGDARVTGLSVTATSAAPTGTAIAYETRTADTAAGLDAATWAAARRRRRRRERPEAVPAVPRSDDDDGPGG